MMKTNKLLGLIIVLIYIGGCNQDNETKTLDSYISKSSAFICQELFHMGQSIDIQENAQKYEYESEYRSGVVDCNEIGNFHLGQGDASQIIMIDRLVFRLNEEDKIIQLTGRWREINNKGKESLQRIRDNEYNIDWGDSEKYFELAEHKLNDLDKMMYEIERRFGPSTSIRPVTWELENGSFEFSRSNEEYETLFLVTVHTN